MSSEFAYAIYLIHTPQLSPEKEMNDYTAMRLYTRSILYNFIHAKTIEERRIASQMGQEKNPFVGLI